MMVSVLCFKQHCVLFVGQGKRLGSEDNPELGSTCIMHKAALYVATGQEVMYLRKRLGFVRLALKHGVPLVPAFAFGQSDAYRLACH